MSSTTEAPAASLPEPVEDLLPDTLGLFNQIDFKALVNLTLEEIAMLLVATLIFSLLWRWLGHLRPWLLKLIDNARERGVIRSLTLKNIELIPGTGIAQALRILAQGLGITLYLISLLGFLVALSSIFPPTRGVALTALQYIGAFIMGALQAGVAFIPNLISMAFIAFVSWGILRIVGIIARAVDARQISFPGFHRDWAMPTYGIFRFLVIVISVVMIGPYLPGYESPAFKGAAVFLGVLVSLGSSSAVANVIAGIMLIYMRPFKVGDRVNIGQVVGDVMEMSILVTRIKTPKNENITIPNAIILNNHLTNYSSSARKEGLIIYSTVTIGYDVPWPQVHELLTNAAKATQGIEADPEPFVLQKSLDDFYVSYEINACTHEAERMPKIYSDLHQNIQDQFDKAGVEIMSPHYGTLRDGNASTVPSLLSKQGYKASPFHVAVNSGS